MGTTYPPDGYTVASGVWGTDMDMDTSVFLSGDASVKFLSTTPANDPELRSTEIPCEPCQPLLCEGWIRASSVAAGNIPRLWILWLDSSKSYLSATAINDAVLAATDTWYLRSGIGTAPASTCYAMIALAKVKTAFTANFDSVYLRRFPKCFKAYLAADTSGLDINETVPFDTESYDHGSWFNTGTGAATVPATGIYQFSAQLYTDAIMDADEAIFAYLSISTGGGTIAPTGSYAISRADNQNLPTFVSWTGYLVAGDSVVVKLFESHSGSVTLLGTAAEFSWFAGAQIA